MWSVFSKAVAVNVAVNFYCETLLRINLRHALRAEASALSICLSVGYDVPMSDFIGILVTGDTVLHLVDYDRPVWMKPGDMSGLRVVPSKLHFIADALLAFRYSALNTCSLSCGHSQTSLCDLASDQVCQHVDLARERVYADHKETLLLLTSKGSSEPSLASNLLKFVSGGFEVPLDADVADRLGLV